MILSLFQQKKARLLAILFSDIKYTGNRIKIPSHRVKRQLGLAKKLADKLILMTT
jgi:hypothetical protein